MFDTMEVTQYHKEHNRLDLAQIGNDRMEIFEIAEKAMDKQVAKKLTKIEVGKDIGYKCVCGRLYQSIYDKGKRYCEDCGQALDWE